MIHDLVAEDLVGDLKVLQGVVFREIPRDDASTLALLKIAAELGQTSAELRQLNETLTAMREALGYLASKE